MLANETLPRLHVTRYVRPLREGGSLPAIVEADDGGMWVAKWRGAGQGAAALVAEVIVGQLARALGLRVPELALLELDEEIARNERHDEIVDLLRASVGTNFAMRYMPGAIAFDPGAVVTVDPAQAARIVLFDAFVTNVDRTARNPNLLWSKGELCLIDHGAALYWHHDWDGGVTGAERSFPLVRDHVLLPRAEGLAERGAELMAELGEARIAAAVAAVPDVFLEPHDPESRRDGYVRWLTARRDAASAFIEEAVRARSGV
jgi:HipA-like protein